MGNNADEAHGWQPVGEPAEAQTAAGTLVRNYAYMVNDQVRGQNDPRATLT